MRQSLQPWTRPWCAVLLALVLCTFGKAVATHSSLLNAVATFSSKCPCKFVIIVPRNSDPLDFTVSTLSKSGNNANRVAVERISKYYQNSSNAFAVNDSSAFHNVVVPINAHVLLSVFPSVQTSRKTSSSLLKSVQIMESRADADSCPVLLPQHPPRTDLESSRIIGGAPTNEDLTRYMAVLGVANYDPEVAGRVYYPFCSGVIISPRHIVTAAHCKPTRDTIVVIGSADVSNRSLGERVFIESVHIHPQFSDNFTGVNYDDDYDSWNDIAYLTLMADISPSFGFMQVNTLDTAPVPESLVRNIGYGTTTPDRFDVSNVLSYQIDVITSSDSICAELYSTDSNYEEEKVFCVGYPYKGGCGACNGDSGGPVIQYDSNGAPVLVGIAFAAQECADSSIPYICTKISGFNDFLPSNRVTRTDDVSPEFYSGSDLEPDFPSSEPNVPSTEPTPAGVPNPVSPSPDTINNGLSPNAIIGISVSAGVAVLVIFIIAIAFAIRQIRQN